MSNPAVTYTFSNGTTADASQVNTNFTDLINGAVDGTKDYNINALTCAGTATFNGDINLGNGSVDTVTMLASLGSDIPIKTTATYKIGASTLGLLAAYFGANSQTVNIRGSGSMSATYTITLPTTAGTVDYALLTDGNGVTSWSDLTTSLGNAAATRQGKKLYLGDATTTYNAGGTITVSGVNWTTLRAVLVPYQLQDGTWRLRFNIAGTFSVATTNTNLSITSCTSSAQDQAILFTQVTNSTGALINSYWPLSTSQPTFRFSTAVTDVRLSGDIELASKPTWAY